MTKVDLTQFDHRKVAQLDADMWRSYYNHQFFRLFWQLVLLVRYQLGFGWLMTLRLAYYAAWAAADYRINRQKGVNEQRIVRNLTHFYRLASDHSTAPFDHRRAAELEFAWWQVHRLSRTNNPELERALAEGAAAIYNVPASKLADYARNRAEAMILPRHRGDDQQRPTDWNEVGRLVVVAWRSLHEVVQK